MNFQQLEYILAVDQHKHFGKAAFSCDITQATLSAMIKKLEEELQVVIFDRSRQPIQTTEEGEQIMELAKKILANRRELLDLKDDPDETLKGTIRIGIIPTVASSLLPIIIPDFLKSFPELELDIVEITTERIQEELANENIDVGILATPLENENLEENILYYEAMMVYGIGEDDKKFVTPKDVINKKVWLLEEGNCFRNQAVTLCALKEKVVEPKNLNFEATSFDTLLHLTDQFGGVTLVPELYYNLMPENRKEKTKHFTAPMPVREISMVYQRPYVRKRSIDILSEKIRELIAHKLITHKFKPKDMSIIGI
ncbi:hydrogen peroxide-inducible genes activator [Sediminitomix flava]|uniref:LysR family hydrogen peroxide-inducible transcriptional activator n=1 Tax=Sediminitomix flava TaxID=379075 RepID=A0A315Z5X0_SEDFL|nr:hydrogen peroxide-inducible genes activator [Sediminitomix flava]PWJ39298.1 LysR family hydrogen peroxide-inducible transcriptional activator [Sediminitomix flava]